MGNPLVELAIKGLSLVGIDVPPSAEGFIEMIINAGEDAVTQVPRIISIIEQLGGETWSTIEQLVNGMEQYGPVGYIQHLIDQSFSPHVETIRYIHRQKQILLENHRVTLATFKTQMQALFTGPQAYSGLAATQAQAHLDLLTTKFSGHLDLLEQTNAADQKFFSDYHSASEAIFDAEIIILIVIGVVLIIWLASIALSGGATLAIGVAGFGTSSVAISSMGAWLLAGLVAVFDTWVISYDILNKTQIEEDLDQLFEDIQKFLNQQRIGPQTPPHPNTKPNDTLDPFPIPLDPNAPPRTKEETCDKNDWASFVVMFGAGYVGRIESEHPIYACFILKELRDIQTQKPGLMGGMYLTEGNLLYAGADSSAQPTKANNNTGESTDFQGAFFQLQWVHDHLDSVKDTEVIGKDGVSPADAELYDGTIVECKDEKYDTLSKTWNQDIKDQVQKYRSNFPSPPPHPIHLVFNATKCGGTLPRQLVIWLNNQAPSVTYELWTPQFSD